MKKFMIFLLMAFLYLGTSQASNEFTPSSNDVGKSLHHWVSPSVSSPAYAKFKPFSSFAPVPSGELTDSVIRVRIEGPTHACPGQRVVLTAIIENDYLGISDTEIVFRRNGNYQPLIGTAAEHLPNRIEFVVPDLGGLDSLIQEYDVIISHGCKTFVSPVHYLHVYSINVQLADATVCDTLSNVMMCTQVFSNGLENPYAYVWYDVVKNEIVDTTPVPCKELPVGKYVVEPHFTWNGCVRKSDTAEVKVFYGPKDDHITLDSIAALACNGNQVNAKLNGIIHADSLGTPSIVWSLNGIVIPGAHDSTLIFSPLTIAGDTTMYVLKAEVSYANFACKTFTDADTIKIVNDPEVNIYGDMVVCGVNLDNRMLIARTNGYIANATYTWKIDGTEVTYTGLKDTLKLSQLPANTLVARSNMYEVTVKVSGGNGCSASSQVFPLYVNDIPVVHVGRSADSVCNGTAVTLTASLENNNIQDLTYEWYYKKGSAAEVKDSIATSAQYVTNVVDSTTTYKVFVKQASGCESVDSTVVAVYPKALPVQDLVLVMSDTAVCYGDHVSMTLVDTANTKQYGVEGTYQWLVNGVELDDAEGKVVTFSPEITDRDSAVYTITVNATYTTTCETMVTSIDTTIVLFKKPTVEISGDPIVCHDSNVVLTANIRGSLDTNNYLWRVDGVDSIKNKPFKAKLTERDYPYNITVVVAPGTACEVVSAAYPVIIGNAATAALETSDTIVCKGTNVTLTAHLGDSNMPNLTYQWYKKEGAGSFEEIPIGTSRELTIPVANTTNYFVKITQVNSGCVAYSDTIPVKVYDEVATVKDLVMHVSSNAVCNGGQIAFAIIDTANYNLYKIKGTYQWAVNGVTVANATDSIFIFSPMAFDNDSTLYNIAASVTYNTPCVVISAAIDTNVNVFPNPSVEISGDPIVCEATSVNLIAVVHDTLPGTKYLWRVDGADSVGKNTNNFNAVLLQRDYPYEITVVLNPGTACEVVSEPYTVIIGNKATAALETSDTIVCKGTDVTLTAHLGDYNMPNLTYKWYKKERTSGGFESIAIGTSRILTIPVVDSTAYFVKITQVNSGCVAYSDTISVDVFEEPAPVKDLVLFASDSIICNGGEIAFAVIDTANYNQYKVKGTYKWAVNGVTIANATDSIFNFSPVAYDSDSTLYTVAASVTYNTPCVVISAAIDTNVYVFGNPSVVISGDPILCEDSLVTLIATVHDTIIGKKVEYIWRIDGIDTVGMNTNKFETTLAQRDYPYEITVLVNQGAGCVASDTYSVLIGIHPTVNIEASAPIVCKGEEVTLTAHLGDYNMPNLTYQWYSKKYNATSDSIAIPIGTSRILTVPVNDTTKYTVVVTQVNSKCFATADTVINIFKADPPVQPIELVASDSNICIGGQIAYAVQDTVNRNQYFGSDSIPGAYRWFVNGFELMTVSGDHFMFSPSTYDLDSTNYVIEVVASYQTECNLWVTSAADTITAHRNPSVVINGDPMICDTNTVLVLTAIVNDTLVDHTVEYLWRVDGVDSTTNGKSKVFAPKLAARDYPYEITVMINQGTNCEVVSEPFYLYVDEKPSVAVTVDYDTVCVGQLVTLTAHLGNYNQPNLTYQWYADDTVLVAEGTESTLAYTIQNTDFTAFRVVVTQLNSACQGTGRDTVVTVKNPVFDTVMVTNIHDDDAYFVYSQHYNGEPAYDVCEGAAVKITAYMKDPSGNPYIDTNITYKWRRNGVIIEGVNGYSFIDNQLSIYDGDQYKYVYTVEVENPQYPNCYATPVSQASDTVRVRRNPVVVINGPRYVCYSPEMISTIGYNVQLHAMVDGVGNEPGSIFKWYVDGEEMTSLNISDIYSNQGGAVFQQVYAPRYGYDYVFRVEVLSGIGCTSWSDPFPVTVMARPVINITPYADTVCTGGEVILVSHLDDYNVTDYELQYQWYANEVTPSGMILGETSPYIATTVDTTTNFIVGVKYLTENTDNDYFCSATDTVQVTVYDTPIIDSIIMSLTEACEGSQIELTAVMDSVHQGVPNVPYIYEWYRNSERLLGNAVTIYDNPMTVDGNEQQFVYSVKVYQDPERLHCESPIYVSSQTLTVFPNPIVGISGDQHICHTDTIMLLATMDTISNPVSTNVHYYWFESGAPIENIYGDSCVLRYYGDFRDEPYRFFVMVERDSSITGCRSYSYEYDVWVYDSPVANVTIVDTAVCEGATVTVSAHLNQNVPEQTNLEFQWYKKGLSDSDFILATDGTGATSLDYTTTIYETTEFVFKVRHTLSGCFDTDTTIIHAYPVPVVASVSMSDTNVCEGSDVIITAHIDSTQGIPGLPYFYEWRRNGELLEGNTATIHDHPMTADGTTERYTYSAIAYQRPDRLACVSDLTNSAELTVFGNPRVAISGDMHVCYTDTIYLTANVDTFAYPVGALHYIWYESGNPIVNMNGDNKLLKYYAPAQDEPYRFTVQIERDNAEAACRMYSDEYDVHVYEAPEAHVTIVDENVCEGAEVTVTAHLDLNTPEQTHLKYQWYTKTTSDSVFVLVPSATALTYTTTINETTQFMFRVEHDLSHCFDTDTTIIYTHPVPVVNFVSMSDTNICEGGQVTIYADIDTTKGVAGQPYFYEWRRNGELLAANTQTIEDSPMTVDGNEQTFVYSVIAYQTPERLACYSALVESATLNVYPNPRVAISGDQYVCETDSVFLYANVDTIGRPVGLLHYTWYESGRLRDNMAYGLADSRFFSEYFYAQDEPYRFTVEVHRDNIAAGCRAYSEEFLVWVYKQPVVNITASETEVCVGGEVTLRANLDNYEFNYANNAQYQWYTVDTVKDSVRISVNPDVYVVEEFVEHNPIPGATMLTYTVNMAKTQVYAFTATHNLSGCSDYDEITITVNDIPVIDSIDNIVGKDTICPGGRVELHANISGGVAGGEVYTWYRNGVELESTGENLIDYPLAVDNNITRYIYEVKVKQSAAGCESVIDSLSTDTIWVVPNPTIELAGDPIVCDTTNGNTNNVVITANVVSYVDTTNFGYTYQWYENNAPIEGETGLVLSINKDYRQHPYSFNFEVMNPYGCTVLSEPFLVYVNDNPIVGITVDDTMICKGGSVTLAADIYDQNANNLVFEWYQQVEGSSNWDSIPGAYSMTLTIDRLDTTTSYKFFVYQRDSECSAYSNVVKVNVVPAPTVDSITVVSVDTMVCEGHIVTLYANVTGGDNVDEYVYTWYKDNEVVEGQTGISFTDYPMSVDNEITTHVYNVTVAQASSMCFSTYDVNDEITVTVRPNPVYTIYGDADVCEANSTDNNITLYARTTDSLIVSNTAYSYRWYEEDTLLADQTNSSLTLNRPYRTEPYIFKAVVFDTEFGCTSETEEFEVYVSARPIVTVTSSEDTICENGIVTLTANIYDQNAEFLTFQWWKKVNGVGDSTIINGANNVTYTTAVDSTTEFFVVVKQLTTDCQAVASTTVKVNAIPVITKVDNLSGHDTLCPGGRVELHANISGGVAGGEVYTWYRNGVELESTGDNLIDYPAVEDNNVAQYIYEVTVRQNAAACQSVITLASQDTIWIVPNPTIELSGDPIVCDTTNGNTDNVVITANVVSYVDTTNYGYTYQWYENNAPINGETGLVLSIDKDYRQYPYSFNFEVKNPYGCTVLSEPFLVYVNDNPIVGITVDDTMICKGGSVALAADLYDQNANNLVFVWYQQVEGSSNWDSIPGAYSMTLPVDRLDTTTSYKFYVYQRDSECSAYSNVVKVNVVPAPKVDSITLVSEDNTICEGHIVKLHANVIGGDNVDEYIYTWYKDNQIVEGQNGIDFTDYPMSVDNDITEHVYNVTVAQASSMCSSLYDTATEVKVSVRPNPRYVIYGDNQVCEDSTIVLFGRTTDSVITSNSAYTYTWYESGVEETTQTTDTLKLTKPYREYPYIFKLVVTDTEFGCTTETEEFEVYVAKRPVVVIAVDQDSICQGGFVTLTSTLVNQTEEGIVYQWQKDNSGVWANIEGAIAPVYVTPALTTDMKYRLTVENTLTGCTANSNEVDVTVKATPSINIVSMTDTILCNGGEVTFVATDAANYQGLGEINYQWFMNGQAIPGANQNVYTTSPLTADGDMTTYSIGVQVSMSNSGCVSNIDTNLVTVYADPTVNITYSNGLSLCKGGSTTLKANPNHPYFTDYTYQWYLHGMPIPGANDTIFVVENLAPSANAYDYTVEVTVNHGSQLGCSAVAEPVNVVIYNDPTAYITVNENVNAICEGGTVTFTVHVNDGVADTYNPYTYVWYNNVSGFGDTLGTEASYTTSAADAPNFYYYFVDVTSAYGCNVRVGDTLRIVADPTVTVAVKTGEDTVVCDGGHTTLIATVAGGLGTPTYQWYKNGYEIPGATGRELETGALYSTETAAYTVSVTQSGIACTATSTQPFIVPVFQGIDVALSTSSEFNCVGGSVTLTATTTNGIPNDVLTYTWFRNGNPINGATTAQYVTDDNLVAGLYEYQVEVSSTISGCHVSQSGTIGVTVEEEPTVTISSDVEGNSICAGGDITLTANVTYATNPTGHNNTYTYTWKWYENTTLMTVQTTQPHFTLPTTLVAGSYNFYVEIESNDGLGCDASSQPNLFNVVVKPVPSVILTQNAAESCQGGDVTFNAVVIPSNLTGIFYWNINGVQMITDNANITVNSMAVGTNIVSVEFVPNNSQNACTSPAATITHVVNAAPVVTLTATDNSRLAMCAGGTITISATATGTATSSDRYVWVLDNTTQVGNNGSYFTAQLNTPGTHMIKAMVERTMGCNSDYSTPIVVTVAEQPTAQLTQTAGYTEMCAGGTITLMAKVPNFSAVNDGVTNSAVHGTYTYTWYRDNADFNTTSGVTVDNAQINETLNAPAAYTYSVSIAASGYNCHEAYATLDHQIRVVPDPSWSVNQVNPTELCIGGIVTLNAEVTGGVENQQAGRIQWFKNFNGVESEVAGLGGQNTDVPELAGTYTYIPKYIDYIGAGCNIADATATQVTVNALPTAYFTSGHGSVICGHDYQSFASLQITLTGTAPFTFTIMNVTTGETQTIVTSLNVYTYNVNPDVTSIYRIMSVSDANGCVGEMNDVADAVVSVSDVRIAAESVLADCDSLVARIPVQVVSSSSTNFTATLPNGTQQYGNIMFDNYTQAHYVLVYMAGFNAGDYVVTIDIDGCSGDVLVRVPANDYTIGVTSALVEQRWEDVVVVNNNPANNGGFKFNRYQWYKNGEPISGATGQYYQEVGGLEGYYTVELDGVRVSDSSHVHFLTCEKYFSGKSSIKVYPVPAKSTQEVTIELNMSDEELEGAILDIYDIKGVHVRTLNDLRPVTKVGNFGAQGTYFGRIITGTNEIKTVKFIIVK